MDTTNANPEVSVAQLAVALGLDKIDENWDGVEVVQVKALDLRKMHGVLYSLKSSNRKMAKQLANYGHLDHEEILKLRKDYNAAVLTIKAKDDYIVDLKRQVNDAKDLAQTKENRAKAAEAEVVKYKAKLFDRVEAQGG